MQQGWGWGALWGLGFDGIRLGLLWPDSDPVDGVEVPTTSLQSQHGFPLHSRPSGDPRVDRGNSSEPHLSDDFTGTS